MTHEQAAYDLEHLPLRQAMLRHMITKETHHTVEGIRVLRAEYAENARRIALAKHKLGRA